jgi:lactoylglutathione lyase
MIGLRFDHVHLMADDMEATARWFVERLGGQAAGGVTIGERQRRDVDVGGIRLFISPRVPNEAAGDAAARGAVDHLAFAVVDIDAAMAALTAAGVTIVKPIFESRPGVRAAFVEGPDGIRIELLCRAAKAAHGAG